MTPLQAEIASSLASWVRGYGADRMARTAWLEPLVGWAAADDPLFELLREAVSPTHARPGDLLPGARSVIAWFLPFDEPVARSNRAGRHSSEEWGTAYVETNRLIAELGERLRALLERRGHRLAILPATHNFDPEKLVSDWSHRHVAWIAGLGSFGRHNLLITERGCCGRLGSAVTDLPAEPTARDGVERCLHRRDGSCGRCVERCVNGALGAASFERRRCYAMCLENGARLARLGRADVCGKCAVGLPCSHRSPGHSTSAGAPG